MPDYSRFPEGIIARSLNQKDTADPGDAGAIPVTECCNIRLVTAGAETRTIAVPTQPGVRLNLYFQTDGGDCVITVASAFNVTGNTVITLADAGDSVILESMPITASTYAWRLVHNDGGALS